MYVSRIKPHFSASTRFVDKKRNHLRKMVLGGTPSWRRIGTARPSTTRRQRQDDSGSGGHAMHAGTLCNNKVKCSIGYRVHHLSVSDGSSDFLHLERSYRVGERNKFSRHLGDWCASAD